MSSGKSSAKNAPIIENVQRKTSTASCAFPFKNGASAEQYIAMLQSCHGKNHIERTPAYR